MPDKVEEILFVRDSRFAQISVDQLKRFPTIYPAIENQQSRLNQRPKLYSKKANKFGAVETTHVRQLVLRNNDE